MAVCLMPRFVQAQHIASTAVVWRGVLVGQAPSVCAAEISVQGQVGGHLSSHYTDYRVFKIYKEAKNTSPQARVFVFFFIVVIFLQPVPGTAGIVAVRNLYRQRAGWRQTDVPVLLAAGPAFCAHTACPDGPL